jgi:tRNA(Ser,Leu) C12 N-acetylase TAN1
LRSFNLVATTQRGNEWACMKELGMLCESLGFEGVRMKRTGFPGLVIGLVDRDPIALVRAVRAIVEEDPWDLRFLQKLTPIEVTVETNIGMIAEAVGKLAQRVPEGKSFRISINKRGCDIASQDVILAAASKVQRRVNLDRPDWVVQIEVIEDAAGVSVLEPKDILSVTKLQEMAMQN